MQGQIAGAIGQVQVIGRNGEARDALQIAFQWQGQRQGGVRALHIVDTRFPLPIAAGDQPKTAAIPVDGKPGFTGQGIGKDGRPVGDLLSLAIENEHPVGGGDE